MKIKTIVLAVDFSDHSEAATDAARDLAREFGARVHLVHAFELATPLVSPYQAAVPDLYLVESRTAVEERLGEIQSKLSADGVETTTHLSEAPAAPAIARIAEQVAADLIVMGTRGVTGLKHFVLGSVAERTLRLAPCSVLTVKLPDD